MAVDGPGSQTPATTQVTSLGPAVDGPGSQTPATATTQVTSLRLTANGPGSQTSATATTQCRNPRNATALPTYPSTRLRASVFRAWPTGILCMH